MMSELTRLRRRQAREDRRLKRRAERHLRAKSAELDQRQLDLEAEEARTIRPDQQNPFTAPLD